MWTHRTALANHCVAMQKSCAVFCLQAPGFGLDPGLCLDQHTHTPLAENSAAAVSFFVFLFFVFNCIFHGGFTGLQTWSLSVCSDYN